ncbi:MAG: cation:proton antiporter [Candidatus Eiseniibacteriota bacterium]
MSHFATLVALIGIVVIVASLLSGVLERRRVPIVAVFLGLGLLLGPWGLGLVDIGFASPELQALSTLALVLVLFSDAVTFDIAQIKLRRPLLLRILGPGTLGPALLITVAAKFLLALSWPAAAILGAALASTDPVLLRVVLRSRSLPESVRTALRMESGMNDIVLLPIVILSVVLLGGAVHGGAVGGASRNELVRHVLGLFLLGPLVGALIGWAGIIALGWVRDRVGVRRDYESLYALGLAFSAFAAAEAVGGSGFVAAFAAGLLVASQDVELCDCFLEYGEATAEMLLLLTFVALGTTLIWTGLGVINGRTVLFALIALATRTAVLYPVLGGLGLSGRDHRLIALLGPRGLSSLLLVLLAVFANVPGSQDLFAVTCLVVLLSVVVHGIAIAVLLPSDTAPQVAQVPSIAGGPAAEAVPLRITIEEVRAARTAGENVVVLDVRKEKSFREDPRLLRGALRLSPDDAVREAGALQLPMDATLAIYCS